MQHQRVVRDDHRAGFARRNLGDVPGGPADVVHVGAVAYVRARRALVVSFVSFYPAGNARAPPERRLEVRVMSRVRGGGERNRGVARQVPRRRRRAVRSEVRAARARRGSAVHVAARVVRVAERDAERPGGGDRAMPAPARVGHGRLWRARQAQAQRAIGVLIIPFRFVPAGIRAEPPPPERDVAPQRGAGRGSAPGAAHAARGEHGGHAPPRIERRVREDQVQDLVRQIGR